MACKSRRVWGLAILLSAAVCPLLALGSLTRATKRRTADDNADPLHGWRTPELTREVAAKLQRRIKESPVQLRPSRLPASARRLSDPTLASPLGATLHRAARKARRLTNAALSAAGRRSSAAAAFGRLLGPAKGGKAAGAPRTPSSPAAGPLNASAVRVFVGIQTAPSPPNAEPFSKYDYAARRHAIRQTWMAEAARFPHMAVRFVVGRGPDGQLDPGLAAEAAEFGDFMVLDVQDCYTCLTNKSKAMFVEVARAFPGVEWVVKADDDTYILAWRLLMALDQYAAAGADYIGCLDTGATHPNATHRWYEPNWPQLGTNYFTRAMGSIYVLSARVVRGVIARRPHTLRQSLSAEDSAVGMWLLGSSALFLDDLRLCSLGCSEASVGMWDPRQQGLTAGASLVLHASPQCRAAVRKDAWPLPYAVRPPQLPHKPTPAQREAWHFERARQRVWARMRK